MLLLNLMTSPSLVHGTPSVASALQSRSKRTLATPRTLLVPPVMPAVNKVKRTRMMSPSEAADEFPLMYVLCRNPLHVPPWAGGASTAPSIPASSNATENSVLGLVCNMATPPT